MRLKEMDRILIHNLQCKMHNWK